MQTYDKYKDSGVEWAGDIPFSWNRFRIKFALSNSNAGVWGDDEKGDENDIACFRVADFDYIHGCLRFDKLTYRNIEKKQLENRELHRGDLLIEKSGGGDATPVGRVVRFNFEDRATCSNFVNFVSMRDNYDSNFFYYYFNAIYSNKENMLYFNQTTGIQNLKIGEYLGQLIYLPSYQEQQSISSYLDKKCADIDKVIATQQRRIELLQELKQSTITYAVTRGLNRNAKMKDSGVEWIGEVPEHWEIKRMRFLCKMETGNKDTINKEDDGKYPFFVRSPKIERINTYSFDGESILMAGDGVGAGKVIHYYNGKFDYHQRVYNFHHYKEIKTKLAFYYIQSNFKYIIEEGGAKNTVDSVRLPWLKDFPICIPPVEEQDLILSFVENNSQKYDNSISKAQKEIDLLQEYKQALITEVVTGKRKVC